MTYLHLIDGMAYAKGIPYRGDKFKYCPWCGHKLEDDGEDYLGELI